MKTRIKFIYDADYDGTKGKNRHNSIIAISRDYFNVDDKQVRVFLNLKEFFFEFITDGGEVVHRGGKTTNTEVLLRQAKRELRKKGCRFGKETRETNKDE